MYEGSTNVNDKGVLTQGVVNCFCQESWFEKMF